MTRSVGSPGTQREGSRFDCATIQTRSTPASRARNSGTVEMFQKMADGDIKACWIVCTNPVASVANRRTVIEGLEAAE
ncbi:hypothetical protein, partial [Streptomyces sp. Agncl-13]|uniref:hypothetical protein n=1 Tax=Streptomyces sp. Agncl-13 TaxID=3400628 RepID=UPI003A86AC1A